MSTAVPTHPVPPPPGPAPTGPGSPLDTVLTAAGLAEDGAVEIDGAPSGAVYLVEGGVSYVETPDAPGIGERLIAAGRLTADEWTSLRELGGAGNRFAELLAGYGIERHELASLTESVVVDSILALLPAAAGQARFVAGRRHWMDVGIRLDGAAVRDVLALRAPGSTHAAIDAESVICLAEPDWRWRILTADQWQVLCRLPERARIRDLARTEAVGVYEVVDRIAALVEAGLCSVLPASAPAAPWAEPPTVPELVPLPAGLLDGSAGRTEHADHERVGWWDEAGFADDTHPGPAAGGVGTAVGWAGDGSYDGGPGRAPDGYGPGGDGAAEQGSHETEPAGDGGAAAGDGAYETDGPSDGAGRPWAAGRWAGWLGEDPYERHRIASEPAGSATGGEVLGGVPGRHGGRRPDGAGRVWVAEPWAVRAGEDPYGRHGVGGDLAGEAAVGGVPAGRGGRRPDGAGRVWVAEPWAGWPGEDRYGGHPVDGEATGGEAVGGVAAGFDGERPDSAGWAVDAVPIGPGGAVRDGAVPAGSGGEVSDGRPGWAADAGPVGPGGEVSDGVTGWAAGVGSVGPGGAVADRAADRAVAAVPDGGAGWVVGVGPDGAMADAADGTAEGVPVVDPPPAGASGVPWQADDPRPDLAADARHADPHPADVRAADALGRAGPAHDPQASDAPAAQPDAANPWPAGARVAERHAADAQPVDARGAERHAPEPQPVDVRAAEPYAADPEPIDERGDEPHVADPEPTDDARPGDEPPAAGGLEALPRRRPGQSLSPASVFQLRGAARRDDGADRGPDTQTLRRLLGSLQRMEEG